jgi:GH25 family lysozyme M1 (1,4-beta-N-acetylmuramidase)
MVGVAVLALGLAGVANAGTKAAPLDPPLVDLAQPLHPDDDFLGSTISSNEPTSFWTVATPTSTANNLAGIDVSHYQGTINWASVAAGGARFAYLKATESTTFVDPQFSANFAGALKAGVIRGAYHFALPDRSSGAAQANYFVAHGGGWVADGYTLPPVLDIEYNPYNTKAVCYGLTQPQMVAWIADFADTVHQLTKRWPVIYSTTNWWSTCTGNSSAFAANDPLWIARYSTAVGALPKGWGFYTFWQHADSGPLPGDQDYFNGSVDQLRTLAYGGPPPDDALNLLGW